MREGWQGVAVVTGSRPSLAQQVLIGITISVKGEGAGKGGTEAFISPSILCSCTAVCFRAVFPPMSNPVGAMPCPPPQDLLVERFHFKHLLPFQLLRLHSYQQLPAASSLPISFSAVSPFPLLFSNHFCLPLNASSSFTTPSSHLSTAWRQKTKSSSSSPNEKEKSRKTGDQNARSKERGGAGERHGRTFKSILVLVRGDFSRRPPPALLFFWIPGVPLALWP